MNDKFKDFKNVPLKEMTPEVLLAQAQEFKLKGVVIIGLLDDESVVCNFTGLNTPNLCFALKKLDSIVTQVLLQTEKELTGPQ